MSTIIVPPQRQELTENAVSILVLSFMQVEGQGWRSCTLDGSDIRVEEGDAFPYGEMFSLAVYGVIPWAFQQLLLCRTFSLLHHIRP